MVHDRTLSAIDLNLLVILRALLRERHVTRAASALGLSQSATSHALARLRELFGDPLLVRTGRGLLLTPRATALLPRLEHALGELSSALSGEPAFDPKTARRSFVIAMSDYEQAVLLAPLLRRLERDAPGIDLEILSGSHPPEQVDAGRVDLASMPGSSPPPRLLGERLLSERFVCLIRRGHPALRRKFTLQRYLELRHVVVAPSGGPGSVVDNELERLGHRRRVAVRVPNFLVAPVIVAGSAFVNTGPERLARRASEKYDVKLVPVPFRLSGFDVQLVWHPRSTHDAAHAWLRRCFVEVASEA